MPISAEPPTAAVDTSVAVATLDAAHAAHEPCREEVRSLRPAIAGHAAFETFSVLTRMRGALAVEPPVAGELLERVFPRLLALRPEQCEALLRRLGAVGISGGAAHDALVGEAARVHDVVLLTRDRRAARTYDLIGVEHRHVGP